LFGQFQLLAGGRFYIGRSTTSEGYLYGFYGVLDQFFLMNRAVQSAESLAEVIFRQPTDSVTINSLLAFWTFENVTSSLIYSNFGPIQAHSVFLGSCVSSALQRHPKPVVLVPSPAQEAFGSGMSVYRTAPGHPLFINLTSPLLTGTANINTIPVTGLLFAMLSGGSRGAQITAGALPFNAPYGVDFESDSPFGSVSFVYEIAGEAATVVVTENRAPSPQNVTFFLNQGDVKDFILTRVDYLEPGSSALVASRYTVDLDGEPVGCNGTILILCAQ
jgi:hypothetical protein